MTAPFAKVTWSQFEAPISLASAEEVDQFLDRLSANCKPDSPTLVTIQALGHEVALGLGLPQSIIQVSAETGDPPYMVTVGDSDATGSIDFFFHGYHHTEVLCRNLVPAAVAREVVVEFLRTGHRSAAVQWEEV